MAHHNTILNQLLKMIPRHQFEALADRLHSGRKFRSTNRWSQFVALTVAQLSGRASLRDIVDNMRAQGHKLYHLGCRSLSKSNLARINEEKPYVLYEEVFNRLLARCQDAAPKHKFRFKNPLYSLDATVIDLSLRLFPWAKFRSTKGAIKLHVGLDHGGYLPTFVALTDGKSSDINGAEGLDLPHGSIVACDRAYVDYSWFHELDSQGIFFVTRVKRGARYRTTERRKVNRSSGLTSDQTIEWTAKKARKDCPIPLRRVGFRDPDTGIQYYFLTNNFRLAARTIAEIYKQRWQVELFFKWIKQNLKIKTFVGTSRNAVLTQIWIAMCVYLMLAFLKHKSKLSSSLQELIRLFQLNLFERRDLMALLRKDPPRPPDPYDQQLGFTF